MTKHESIEALKDLNLKPAPADNKAGSNSKLGSNIQAQEPYRFCAELQNLQKPGGSPHHIRIRQSSFVSRNRYSWIQCDWKRNSHHRPFHSCSATSSQCASLIDKMISSNIPRQRRPESFSWSEVIWDMVEVDRWPKNIGELWYFYVDLSHLLALACISDNHCFRWFLEIGWYKGALPFPLFNEVEIIFWVPRLLPQADVTFYIYSHYFHKAGVWACHCRGFLEQDCQLLWRRFFVDCNHLWPETLTCFGSWRLQIQDVTCCLKTALWCQCVEEARGPLGGLWRFCWFGSARDTTSIQTIRIVWKYMEMYGIVHCFKHVGRLNTHVCKVVRYFGHHISLQLDKNVRSLLELLQFDILNIRNKIHQPQPQLGAPRPKFGWHILPFFHVLSWCWRAGPRTSPEAAHQQYQHVPTAWRCWTLATLSQ